MKPSSPTIPQFWEQVGITKDRGSFNSISFVLERMFTKSYNLWLRRSFVWWSCMRGEEKEAWLHLIRGLPELHSNHPLAFSYSQWRCETEAQERSSGVNHKTARKGRVSIKIGEKNKIKIASQDESEITTTKYLRKTSLRVKKLSN